MTNPSKVKGTAFESALVKFLKSEGHRGAMRPALKGAGDVGDVWDGSPPNVIFECKSGQAAERASLNQIVAWQMEARAEMVSAQALAWVLVVKRKGTGLANMAHQRAFLEVAHAGFSWPVEVTLEQASTMLAYGHILKG